MKIMLLNSSPIEYFCRSDIWHIWIGFHKERKYKNYLTKEKSRGWIMKYFQIYCNINYCNSKIYKSNTHSVYILKIIFILSISVKIPYMPLFFFIYFVFIKVYYFNRMFSIFFNKNSVFLVSSSNPSNGRGNIWSLVLF